MMLRDLIALLDGEVLTRGATLDIEVSTAGGADLMSDVLYFLQSGSVLLTGLTNPQVVVTADVVDASALIIVRGKRPPPETIAMAEEKGLPLIVAPYTLFECCGRVYAVGIESCDVQGEARRHSDHRLQEYVSNSHPTNA